jgi:hypothetical protein
MSGFKGNKLLYRRSGVQSPSATTYFCSVENLQTSSGANVFIERTGTAVYYFTINCQALT